MEYFDYQSIAQKVGIPTEKLDELNQFLQSEFPGDPMMVELHLLRLCMAIQEKYLTLEEILEDQNHHAAA